MYRRGLFRFSYNKGFLRVHDMLCRTCCSASHQDTGEPAHACVRTRFAPSPTGFLHLGGLRTALYSYLFARQHGGQFILRIENTDHKRLVPGSIGNIIHCLRQVGIGLDEGPGIGGPCGPYIQSQRLSSYRSVVEELLQSGAVYRCFCSVERLAMMRHQDIKQGRQPRYSNRCRQLSEEKINHYLSRRVPHVFRLKLDETCSLFTDVIHGEGCFDSANQEGDPVLLKSNGMPTYHLASVVDDHHMGITHILRGYEWYISTPKHLALYRALGWNAPQIAHLPLICNSDGTKLSKRQSDISVDRLLSRGFMPEALLQYVCMSGGGFSGGEIGTHRLVSIAELIDRFDLSRIGRHTYQLQESNLNKLNQLALRRYFCGFDCEPAVLDSLGSPQQLQQLATESEDDSCPPSRLHLRNVLRKCIDTSRSEKPVVTECSEQQKCMAEQAEGGDSDLDVEGVESISQGDQAALEAALSVSTDSTSTQNCPDISDTYIDHVLAFYIGASRVCALDTLAGVDCAYLWSLPQYPSLILQTATQVDAQHAGKSELLLDETVKYIDSLPSDIAYTDLKSKLLSQLKYFSEEHEIKFSQFMTLLRAAISGVQRGPGVAEMIAVLGRLETISRLNISLSYLKKTSKLESDSGRGQVA